MESHDTQIYKLKRAAGIYNALPNLLWSVLAFVPLYICCYTLLDRRFLLIFLALSIFTIFLPKAFFHYIQLGETPAIYKKAGVRFIGKFTQNGQLVNRRLRKRFPRHRIVSNTRESADRLFRQTFRLEKFHFMLFTFFSLVIIYALAKGYMGWALLLLLINVLYNVYPCLLQQYIRLRLTPFMRRNSI